MQVSLQKWITTTDSWLAMSSDSVMQVSRHPSPDRSLSVSTLVWGLCRLPAWAGVAWRAAATRLTAAVKNKNGCGRRVTAPAPLTTPAPGRAPDPLQGCARCQGVHRPLLPTVTCYTELASPHTAAIDLPQAALRPGLERRPVHGAQHHSHSLTIQRWYDMRLFNVVMLGTRYKKFV